jgi:hypothetical protein
MPTFLVWNVQRKALAGHVVRLVQSARVDVLLLIEKPDPDGGLSAILAANGFALVPARQRFGLYTRLDSASFESVSPPEADERTDFWRFRLSETVSITLVAVHGPDRRNVDETARRLFFQRVHENVQAVEARAGHKRTVVVGDFNANPFEESVGGVQGLHAIPVRHVGGRDYRTVGRKDYEFFFNPMWSCYGGTKDRPPQRIILPDPADTRSSGT